MESEKVKEIKKALKYCGYGSCLSCEKYSYILDGCNIALIQDALTLINELEKENKIVKEMLSKYGIYVVTDADSITGVDNE